jgi:hypothetical protein
MAIAMDHYIHYEQDYEEYKDALVPNAQTQEAMRDGDLRRNLTHHQFRKPFQKLGRPLRRKVRSVLNRLDF